MCLAAGRAPRTAACALAALTVPVVLVNQPLGRRGRPDGTATRERFLRALSMLGGALLAAIDREGRPGLAWRVEHAKVDRAARHAAHAVAAATGD